MRFAQTVVKFLQMRILSAHGRVFARVVWKLSSWPEFSRFATSS